MSRTTVTAQTIALAIFCAVCAGLGGCGGGGNSSGGSGTDVVSISVSGPMTVAAGSSIQLQVVAHLADGSADLNRQDFSGISVTWASSNSSVVSITDVSTPTAVLEKVTGIAAGMANLTVTATGGGSTFIAGASITVTGNPQPGSSCGSPQGSESGLNGQYAFLMQGFDAKGAAAWVGSLTFDGTGKITAGQEDLNSNNGLPAQAVSIDTANSSYTIGADNRGCLSLNTSAGAFTYRLIIALRVNGAATKGEIISFDTSGTRVAGSFVQQDPTAFSTGKITGNYAFGVGSTLSGNAGRFAAVGSFVASGGTLTAGAVDTNMSGDLNNTGKSAYPASPEPLTGSYTISSNGRGTMSLNVGGTPVNIITYVISSAAFFVMSSDDQTRPLLAGSAAQQLGMPFSNSSLNAPIVRYLGGLSTSGTGTKEEAGLITIPSPGSLSFSVDINDGGAVSSANGSGTYSVDSSTGRVTATVSAGNPPIFYLTGPNQGFGMSTDSLVSFGNFEPQNGGPFSNASFSGRYFFGTQMPVSGAVFHQTGVAFADGAGNLSSVTDDDLPGQQLVTGNNVGTTYAVDATGRGVSPGTGTPTAIFYIISVKPKRAVRIDEAGIANPSLQILE